MSLTHFVFQACSFNHGHLSVSLESAVYRLVAEPANSNCDSDCDRPPNVPRSLTGIRPALRPEPPEHNRPTPAFQYRTQPGIPVQLKPLILNPRMLCSGAHAPLFGRALIAIEPRHHVHSVRLSVLPQLRDKRVRDALRQQRLERGEFGAFSFTTHRGSLSQKKAALDRLDGSKGSIKRAK